MGDSKTISTGQAARLCSVKPNTVLKWISSGKVRATRTAGGHYRIDKDAIAPFLTGIQTQNRQEIKTESFSSRVPCWVFFAKGGDISNGCKSCIVWQAKSERCYVVADGGRNPDFAGMFCKSTCQECDYYKYIFNGSLRILVISRDSEVRELVLKQARPDMEILFACCGYDACCLVRTLRPNLVIIDAGLKQSDPMDLYEHMSKDPRCKDTRILIGITDDTASRLVPEMAPPPKIEFSSFSDLIGRKTIFT